MAKNIEQTTGPYWTKNWIEAMWRFTVENFVEFDTNNVDFEALGREEYEFRKALFYRNFKNSPRAKEAFAEVKESYKSHVESGRQGGRPRKQETTADAPTREDGEFKSDSGDAGNLESATSANNSEARQIRRTGDCSVRGNRRIESPVRPFRFRNKEEYINWAADSGLDLVDAGECWDATVERGWKDADGKPVNNIKAFASQWCATREEKRNKRRSA